MTKGTDILIARSQRAKHIKTLTRNNPVISLHVNMPGDQKNTPETTIILTLFTHLIHTLYQVNSMHYESLDGNYNIFIVNQDANRLKKTMMFLEDHHPLGRFIDLDVYTAEQNLSREDFNTPKRSCVICGDNVNVCRRAQAHDIETLKETLKHALQQFLIKALKQETSQALRKEIFTYPSFGLVSHKDTGIHKDMNISHFLSAIELLDEAFETYLKFGIHPKFSLDSLNEQGKLFELLLIKSIGVNTLKGAHYLFGLFLPLYIQAIMNKQSLETFLNALKTHAKTLELRELNNKKSPQTRGEKAYIKHQIRGIKGELSEGLPAIFEWYEKDKSYSPQTMLIQIMARLDDTTLMKDDDPTRLKEIKRCMQAALKDDAFEEKALNCLDKKISPGGAADMLALVYFLKQTDYLLA